jgi:hypothetical protein
MTPNRFKVTKGWIITIPNEFSGDMCSRIRINSVNRIDTLIYDSKHVKFDLTIRVSIGDETQHGVILCYRKSEKVTYDEDLEILTNLIIGED